MLEGSKIVDYMLHGVGFKRLGFDVNWKETKEVNPIFKSVALGIDVFETIVEFKIIGHVNYDIYLDVVVGGSLLDLHYCKVYKEDGSKVCKFYRSKELRELQDYLRTQFM
jgi:hypothetical protein